MTSRRNAALVVNPADDDAFRRAVDAAIHDGAGTPEALATALQPAYPRVVARRRELSHEQQEVWYVYREGTWRSNAEGNSARDDFRAASESLAADAARVRDLEGRSAGLADSDPTLEELVRQSDDLTRDMVAKSGRQAELLRESRGRGEAGKAS